MNDDKDLDDETDETDVIGCVVGVLVICVLVCGVIFWIGPLLFFILLIPILWFLVLLVSIYGLAFGDPENRWRFLIPLAASLSILVSIFDSSMNSSFGEDKP